MANIARCVVESSDKTNISLYFSKDLWLEGQGNDRRVKYSEEFAAFLRRRRKDWISILKKNRNLETNSFELKDAQGKRIPLEEAHISVEDLVRLIPANTYRTVTVGEQTYWTFTLAVRIPGLGKVRLVISFQNAKLTGTYAVLAPIGQTGARFELSRLTCNVDRLKPYIKMVRNIWVLMNIACAMLKPFRNIGVWYLWRIRFYTWTACLPH